MTREEQIIFVTELCDNLKSSIVKKIDKEIVPERWDHRELRQYVSEQCGYTGHNSSWKDDYNNDLETIGNL